MIRSPLCRVPRLSSEVRFRVATPPVVAAGRDALMASPPVLAGDDAAGVDAQQEPGADQTSDRSDGMADVPGPGAIGSGSGLGASAFPSCARMATSQA